GISWKLRKIWLGNMSLKCEGGTGGTGGTGYPSPFNLPCAYWHSVFFETTRDSKITKIYRGVANRCHHCHHSHTTVALGLLKGAALRGGKGRCCSHQPVSRSASAARLA